MQAPMTVQQVLMRCLRSARSHKRACNFHHPPNVCAGDHQLNAVTQCSLDDEAVVDRLAALDAIEPDRSQLPRLWWDHAHLHADGNHAFNSALLAKLDPIKPSRHSRQSRSLWRYFHRAH